MSAAISAKLLDSLSDRDIALLESLQTYRLLSSPQIRRLHFDPTHTSAPASTRSTNRVLARLEAEGLVRRLQQRVGGAGGGSSSLIWQLGATGEAVLRHRAGSGQRRRYVEPSGMFTKHTLAVADVAISLVEGARTGAVELVRLDLEPACWRRYLTSTGVAAWLKPDLHVITAGGDYEDHAFIEVDLGTEHRPQLLAKTRAFQRYRATGVYLDRHGVFPLVLWVVPDQARRRFLDATLASDKALDTGLFRVITAGEVPTYLGIDPVTAPTLRTATTAEPPDATTTTNDPLKGGTHS